MTKWDRIEANWQQLRGLAKHKWGKLTDTQLRAVAGKRDQLLVALQTQYGISKAEAELEVQEWEAVVERRQKD